VGDRFCHWKFNEIVKNGFGRNKYLGNQFTLGPLSINSTNRVNLIKYFILSTHCQQLIKVSPESWLLVTAIIV
jgi:hypothetical protein